MYEFISATLTISTDGKYMYGHLWASMGIYGHLDHDSCPCQTSKKGFQSSIGHTLDLVKVTNSYKRAWAEKVTTTRAPSLRRFEDSHSLHHPLHAHRARMHRLSTARSHAGNTGCAKTHDHHCRMKTKKTCVLCKVKRSSIDADV